MLKIRIKTRHAFAVAVACGVVCALPALSADDKSKKKKKDDKAAATAPAGDNSASAGDVGKSSSDDRGPSKVAPPPDTPTPTTKADQLEKEADEKARKEREARVPTVVQEAERQKVDKTITGDQLGEDPYQKFRRQIELKAGAKRQELIKQLEQILASNPPDDEKPDLLFQKAELLREEGQQHFFNGMAKDDDIAKYTGVDDNKVMTAMSEKEKELGEQKKWDNEATKLYETIEKKYPKYERMPDVLYSLGQTYWDRTQYQDALKVYRRLIKEYPKAQYIPDAWLAFGEYYFQVGPDEEKDVKKALEAYEKAAANTETAVYGYATYKQGWCHYNLTRFDKATEKFKEVILYSQVKAKLDKRTIGLAKEARKDYVLAYAQYGTAQQAPAEFKTVADDPKDLRGMLERLADIYYGDGKDRDAIITYQTLMKMEPDNTKNPLFQGKIVKLASRIGEKRQVVGQARKLADEYKRVRAVCANFKDGDGKKDDCNADLKAADDVSDNTLRYLATTWHNEAKKTLDNQTFEYAYELYGDYLELFPDRKEAYEMRFFYAELLYKLEKFEQAGEQYVKVFLADKKGKWAEASAEESVRAYDEVVKDFDRANKGKPAVAAAPGAAMQEQPIPEVKKKLMAACKNYIENYPKGKITIESTYKIARLFYEYNYFKESTPRFLEFVDKYPDHPRAEQAANLVLDTYQIVEDYEKLNEVARKFLSNHALTKNEEFKGILSKIVEQSSFKLIAKYEKEKAWEEAGKRYLGFADEFPKSDLADKALANAAAMFTRASQLDRAIKVRNRLIENYKDSPLVPDQMFAVASAYEQIIDYKDAANALEKFNEKYAKDPGQKDRAKDALFNASIYRVGINDTKTGVDDREKYLKDYPNAPEAEDVTYSIATAWEESGQLKKAIDAYEDFSQKWWKKNPARCLNALYKAYQLRIKAHQGKNDIDHALAKIEAMDREYKKTGKPLDDVGDPFALIAFRNADEVLQKYKDIKIAKPDKPAEFKKTLEQKRKAKEAVDAAYLEVVKLKSPEWAVASLFRNGEATADLVKSIGAVPPPKGFTEEQAQLFKSKLEEQTLPMEEAAANYMTLCLDKSAELAVFNEWTKRCLGYLEENRPQTFPKSQLEQHDAVKVTTRTPEHGVGIIADIPKTGEKPKTEPGTEPPPPPTGVKVALPGTGGGEAPAPAGKGKDGEAMNFDDKAAGGGE